MGRQDTHTPAEKKMSYVSGMILGMISYLISYVISDTIWRFFNHLWGVLRASAGRRGLLRFLVFAEQKKSSSFQQNAFDVLGFEHPTAGANQATCPTQPLVLYMYLKKLMYLYPFDMIPDIRYDIRYDISIVLVLDSTEARRSRNLLQTLFNCFLEII